MTTSVGMCFGRTFTASTVTEFATRLEAGGVEELWVVEDCFWTSAPPLAAAVLAVTERLSVGLGILPAVARTAALTAMEIATLASLAPGRVIGGIGHGVQDWMAQMGVKPASPLTALGEVIDAVRKLLAGDTVTVHGRYVTLDDVALVHRPDPVPPVLAGVRGPKSLALAGRVADGVLLDAFTSPAAVRIVQTDCDRDPVDFQYRAFATFCVRPTRSEAYQAFAGQLAEIVAQRHAAITHAEFGEELISIHDKGGADALANMPTELWSQLGAIGTVDDAAGFLNAMGEAGVRSVSLFTSDDLATASSELDDVIAIRSALG